MFHFGFTMRKEVEAFVAEKLPQLKQRHSLCIHIRRGDFIEHEFLESTKEFVEAAVDYTMTQMSATENSRKLTAVLFGQDEEFMNSLNFSSLAPGDVYIHHGLRRGADLYFGARYCDSLVLSASGSMFGFWIAYLSQHATVFYNVQGHTHIGWPPGKNNDKGDVKGALCGA